MKSEGLDFPDNFFAILGFYQCPKTKPVRDKKYLAWVRTLPCAVCGKPGPSEAAHQRILQGGGMGMKPSDYEAIPLCMACHAFEHTKGIVWLYTHRGSGYSRKIEIKAHVREIVSELCQKLLKTYQNQKRRS